MGLNIEWVDPTNDDLLEMEDHSQIVVWEDWIIHDEDGVIIQIGTQKK